MNKVLALFPLELVVFPGEQLKLHVFEPRYKQLINECRDRHIPFGIPAFIEGKVAEYGTEMIVAEVFRVYETGEMDIRAQGIGVFHLLKIVRDVPDRLYTAGEVVSVENDPEAYAVTRDELARQYKRFHEILGSDYEREDFDRENLSFEIGQEVGFTLAEKIRLLSIHKESERQVMIIDHLQRVIPMLEAAEQTRKRVRGNGHFQKTPQIDF
ncbi:MAG: LON peptidase substrate-binding domain-containing protein [Candidatus Hydrogenedentes bacterium]|nr:LON peptidase substrate-binding domain-containing protein [Candidatus Hydrogenedentota bacterium]